MIFNIVEQIADLSSKITLWPGDIIMTGTPEGVAALMEHWLLADAFEREYLAGLYALDSEKNV